MSVTWFNGSIVDNSIALDPADRGLNLGDGVFETIAVQAHHAIWLEEHFERMAGSAHELGIGFDGEKLRASVSAVLAQNTFTRAVLRITLTRGVVSPRALAGEGSASNLLIVISEFTADQNASIKLATSSIRRNESAPSSRLKTLSYIDAIAAAREVSSHADDALMLNSAGQVASTTIGNLFLLRGDELITPQLDQGLLAGVTRAKLLAHASEIGLSSREVVVGVDDIFAADAVFRTNSLRPITAVTALDGKSIGNRSLDIVRQLLAAKTQ